MKRRKLHDRDEEMDEDCEDGDCEEQGAEVEQNGP